MLSVFVDSLYAAFCEAAPGEIRPCARELACRLGLTPIPGVPWSQVFKHAVTLAAPALVCGQLHGVEPSQLQAAVLAHMLAVIEAFGTDRILDAQIEADETLRAVLAEARSARDRALARLDGSSSFDAADGESRAAMVAERKWLAELKPAAYSDYVRLSLSKQAVGFPATLALAKQSGCRPRELRVIEALLADIWLALQHHDDVVDWEDDWRSGGAWAVCLARGLRREDSRDATEPDVIRSFVLRSGVLALLLERARRHYRNAWRRAHALGAATLAEWAKQRAEELAYLASREKNSAGYAVRAFRLAPWAAEMGR